MLKKILLTAVYFILLSSIASAQEKKMTFYSSDDVQLMLEVNGLIKAEGEKIIIELIAPADKRKAEYKEVDIQTGDELVFMNGKKIKSPEDFKKNYEAVESGKELKLGLKRKGLSVIVSFNKMKQEAGGPIRMQTFKMEGKEKDGKVVVDGKELNIDSLKKAGVIIDKRNK